MIAGRVARRYTTRMASSESVDAVAHILMASGGVDPDSRIEFDKSDQEIAYEAARDLLDKVSDILSRYRSLWWKCDISDFATRERVSDSFRVPMRRSGWHIEQYVEVEYPSTFVARTSLFEINLDMLVPPVWRNVRSPEYWGQLRQAVNAFVWRVADVAKYRSQWDGIIKGEKLDKMFNDWHKKTNLAIEVKTSHTVESPDGPVEPKLFPLSANLSFKGKPVAASLKYDEKNGYYGFNVVVGLQVEILPPEPLW